MKRCFRMNRGAPKGNQYAKKAKKKQGISFSYYLNAYEYEFIQQSVRYDGEEPTDANVRAKAKSLSRRAIAQELQRVFVRYASEHPETPTP